MPCYWPGQDENVTSRCAVPGDMARTALRRAPVLIRGAPGSIYASFLYHETMPVTSPDAAERLTMDNGSMWSVECYALPRLPPGLWVGWPAVRPVFPPRRIAQGKL